MCTHLCKCTWGSKVDSRHFSVALCLFFMRWIYPWAQSSLFLPDYLASEPLGPVCLHLHPNTGGSHTCCHTGGNLGSELGSLCLHNKQFTHCHLPQPIIDFVTAVGRSWLYFLGSNRHWVLNLWPQNHISIFYPHSHPHGLLYTTYLKASGLHSVAIP